MAQQIQIRRDTSTNWTTANPILAQGEFGLETNTGKLKIGNGTSNWNSLAYFGGAGALASLTDVSFNSLVSGQIPVANVSGTFINQSLSSLINQYVSFSSLGSLAIMNQLSFTSLLNQPSLGSLAYQNVINYSQVTLTPSLGSLAPMNQLSFTSLTNQPSLSSLAFQSTIDYTTAQLTNKPALGSLAVMNQLSFTSLLNQPSLGSLAFVNSLTKSDVGLGNVTNDAQLKIASNLSDLNNVAIARGNLSLGSLAVLNSVTAVLSSTASLDILYSNGIVNFSGISTNTINSINLVNASTITTNILASIGLINSSTVSTNLLRSNDAMFASTVSMQLLRGNALVIASTASAFILNTSNIFNASTISTNTIASNGAIFASTASIRNINSVSGTFASTVTTNNLSSNTGYFTSSVSVLGTILGSNLTGINTGDQLSFLYGNGSDGDIALNGGLSNQIQGFATWDATNNAYTLIRDVHANTFALGGSIGLNTAGYRIFSKQYIMNFGTFSNAGFNASGVSAGIGALGGFFRSGGNGSPGLPATTSGASGITPPLGTLNTMAGNIGGRGASAKSTVVASSGNSVALASLTIFPNTLGGYDISQSIIGYLQSFFPANASTNIQPTFSLGGGGGAKSAVGTTATSGGGGGGGGVMFLSSPSIGGGGMFTVAGGNGGNATGTGGIFGGGGGGAGGIIAYVNPTNAPAPTGSFYVSGGDGGTSAGTANTQSVTRTENTNSSTATTTFITLTPTQAPSIGTQYLLSIHVSFNAGTFGTVSSVDGMGMLWSYYNEVRFNSIATPTRALFLYSGTFSTGGDYGFDSIKNRNISVSFTDPVNTVRVMLDEIQNTAANGLVDPGVQSAIASSDSTANIITVLGTTPTTGNTQYTVVARNGGTTPVAGTGNTLANQQNTAPIIVSQVAVSRASNNQTWTTAAPAGAITVDISQPASNESGMRGWDGHIIKFNA